MPRAPRTGDWLALLALTAMWGSAFLLTELALQAFAPAVIVASRIVIAAALLYGILRSSGGRLPRTRRSWTALGALAVFGNVLPFNLVAWAQQHISSSLAGVLMAVMPLFVLTLAHFFIPGGRLTGTRVAGFVTGFVGVAIIIGPDALRGVDGFSGLLGAAAALAAAFSYAVSTIIARRAPAAQPLQLAVGTLFVSSLLSAPGVVPRLATITVTDPAALLAVAGLGFLSTGLATILYFRIVQGPGPAFLSLVNYLVPGWAVVLGALVLGEDVRTATFIGLALILGGIAVSEAGPRFKRFAQAVRQHSNTLPSRFARNDA